MSSQLVANCTFESYGRSSHPELDHLATTMPSNTIDSSRSQSRMSISHAKGLLNMPGQNNCFLNSAVQVLWHLDVFRRSFREVLGHACMGESCIFCALKELFNQFQSSKETALPPDSLRLALAEAFSDQRRFQLGYMDDAAECFENILLRIHYHLTNQEVNDSSTQCAPHCISHQKFAMNLFEQIVCHSCGATSDPIVFSQMVQYASTTALCSQEKLFKSDHLSFGSLIKLATSMGDIRNCPKMCGTRISIKKTLVNRPDVVSVGLVWDTEHPTIALIRNVFQLIETVIRLNEVFDLETNVPTHKNAQLNLVGLVTYYGKHYSTYLYHTQHSEWIYFDDATVRVIGPSWQQVVDKCVKGHFQPLLLLYANPDASVVDTKYMLKEVVPMTAIKRPNEVPIPPKTQPITVQPNNYLETPDSPSATSTTSYFSDSTDGYISRKTVENILKIQQNKKKDHNELLVNFNRKNNRNSSSSLDSFDSAIRLNPHLVRPIQEKDLICSLQRRDSGNSSGDRSSSVSSVDTPLYNFRRPLKNSNLISGKHSDQGYDSFSVSSSDSYPSNATSPSKLSTHKLKQIPEDVVQSLETINHIPMTDCDQLCSEVDILLLKSHEKEREGDLRAAAALSDSAASKARIAMDAPYSNHQTLISAKIKHSMCVLRSTSLHKRVKELEIEEKRLLKASLEFHHSRQSSRDSNHGRHSRQGSKDGKDAKFIKETTTDLIVSQPPSNLEIYATLPKKTKKKNQFKCSNGNLTNVETNSTNETSNRFSQNSILAQLQAETRINMHVKELKSKETIREPECSDYYSEWEGMKKKSMPNLKNSPKNSGWQSCRENDSEYYGEIGPSQNTVVRKQCKVKRKLLLGNLLKSKNRSMPDLREDSLNESKCNSGTTISPDDNVGRNAVANVSAKGFHQSHRSLFTGQGLNGKPSLVKVKPPLIDEITSSTCKQVSRSTNVSDDCIYANIDYNVKRMNKPKEQIQTTKPIEPESKPMESKPKSSNPFLAELTQKRREILKQYDTCETRNETDSSTVKPSSMKPSSREIATFISRTVALQSVKKNPLELKMEQMSINQPKCHSSPSQSSCSSPSNSIHMPIPIHATATTSRVTSNTIRPIRPPDYATTLRRIEMNNSDSRTGHFSVPSSSSLYGKVFRNQPQTEVHHTYSLDRTKLSSQSRISATKQLSTDHHQNTTTMNNKPTLSGQLSFNYGTNSKRRVLPKKCVKFSDHIELVACADDYPEEPLPNPLLEKVLSNKNVVYTLQP